uniref:peroxisome assembly protein 26 isoform X2 n=1 Tax=Myxine glutinosa TaxID=7769 RepID=UPI00358DDFAC
MDVSMENVLSRASSLLARRDFPAAWTICNKYVDIIGPQDNPEDDRHQQLRESLCCIAVQVLAEEERWREALSWTCRQYPCVELIPSTLLQILILLHSKVGEPHSIQAVVKNWLKNRTVPELQQKGIFPSTSLSVISSNTSFEKASDAYCPNDGGGFQELDNYDLKPNASAGIHVTASKGDPIMDQARVATLYIKHILIPLQLWSEAEQLYNRHCESWGVRSSSVQQLLEQSKEATVQDRIKSLGQDNDANKDNCRQSWIFGMMAAIKRRWPFFNGMLEKLNMNVSPSALNRCFVVIICLYSLFLRNIPGRKEWNKHSHSTS